MLLGGLRDDMADDPARRSQLQPARQAAHGAQRAIIQAIALRATAFLGWRCRLRQLTRGSHRTVLPPARQPVKPKMLLKACASVENQPLAYPVRTSTRQRFLQFPDAGPAAGFVTFSEHQHRYG